MQVQLPCTEVGADYLIMKESDILAIFEGVGRVRAAA
jgi:hypothetical protein